MSGSSGGNVRDVSGNSGGVGKFVVDGNGVYYGTRRGSWYPAGQRVQSFDKKQRHGGRGGRCTGPVGFSTTTMVDLYRPHTGTKVGLEVEVAVVGRDSEGVESAPVDVTGVGTGDTCGRPGKVGDRCDVGPSVSHVFQYQSGRGREGRRLD